MACMLPLTKRTQLRGKKPRKRKMKEKRDSLVRTANVEAGKVSRHSELTSAHAGVFLGRFHDMMSNVGMHDKMSPSRAPIKKAVLQQCVDCGLTFEGLDELRDHLKVAHHSFPQKND